MHNPARDRLIADNMQMAAACAVTFAAKANLLQILPRDDVHAYAQQGLVEAANRYNPDCGVDFRTFSWNRIRARRARWRPQAPRRGLQPEAASEVPGPRRRTGGARGVPRPNLLRQLRAFHNADDSGTTDFASNTITDARHEPVDHRCRRARHAPRPPAPSEEAPRRHRSAAAPRARAHAPSLLQRREAPRHQCRRRRWLRRPPPGSRQLRFVTYAHARSLPAARAPGRPSSDRRCRHSQRRVRAPALV